MTTHRVQPTDGPISATVHVPGSKSVANRALVGAALADGESTLENVAPGDDTAAMLDCLARLGVTLGRAEDADLGVRRPKERPHAHRGHQVSRCTAGR